MNKSEISKYFCALSVCTLITAQATAKPFTLAYDRLFASPDAYKKQAQERFDRYFSSASQTDLSLLLNLFYTAWARSQANLITRDLIEHARATLSDATHVFALTRLSPALYLPEQTKDNDQKQNRLDRNMTTLDHALAHHKNISLTYHYTLDALFDQHKLASPTALSGLTLVRRDARTAVAQALATVARHLDDIVIQAHAQLATAIENFSHQKLLGTDRSEHRGAIEFLWQYIRRFFERAFFMSDKAYAHGWYAVDQALLMSHSVHNALWHLMEEVRTAFYQAHYALIYDALEKSGAAPQAYCLLFGESGPTSTCPHILPEPHSLSTPFVLS